MSSASSRDTRGASACLQPDGTIRDHAGRITASAYQPLRANDARRGGVAVAEAGAAERASASRITNSAPAIRRCASCDPSQTAPQQ